MSFPPTDPPFRVYVKAPKSLGIFGCAGCLVVLFVLGGLVGVLLLGWKALLGL